MARMRAADIPFLVGGAFAYSRYSGIHRGTKDLDVFLRPEDVPRTLALFERSGYRSELTFPHWLAKVSCDELFIDFIFSSGNGIARVDDAAREVQFALTLRPNDANLLYNVACVYCTMNNRVEALIALKKSWSLGMRDGAWARRDPDLTLLHGDPDFEQLYVDTAAGVKVPETSQR